MNILSGASEIKYNKYSLLMAFLWIRGLFGYIKGAITHIPMIGDFLSQIIIPVSIVLLLCVAWKDFWRDVKVRDIMFCLLVIAIYQLNYIWYPQNEISLNEYAAVFILNTLPFFIVGVAFRLHDLEDTIYVASIVGILFSTVYFLFYVRGGHSATNSIEDDMMGPSYCILTYVCVLIRRSFIYRAKFDIALSILGVIMILSFGTRGPLACLVAFILGYMFFFMGTKNRYFQVITILLLIPFYVYLDQIMLVLGYVSSSLGMSTRIFDSYLTDALFNFQESNGRDGLFYTTMNAVSTSGYGIRGGVKILPFDYAHNIVLDFLIEYGTILGTILFLAILFVYYKGLKAGKSSEIRSFVFLLICIGLMPLFFSFTYLMHPELFLSLGFCVYLIRKQEI